MKTGQLYKFAITTQSGKVLFKAGKTAFNTHKEAAHQLAAYVENGLYPCGIDGNRLNIRWLGISGHRLLCPHPAMEVQKISCIL